MSDNSRGSITPVSLGVYRSHLYNVVTQKNVWVCPEKVQPLLTLLMFSHSVGCLFILLMVSFAVQNFLVWYSLICLFFLLFFLAKALSLAWIQLHFLIELFLCWLYLYADYYKALKRFLGFDFMLAFLQVTYFKIPQIVQLWNIMTMEFWQKKNLS